MPSMRQIYEPVGTGVFAVDAEHMRVARMRPQINLQWSGSEHGFRGDHAERHGLRDTDAALHAAGLDAWLKHIGG
jgi:hypothetical protein